MGAHAKPRDADRAAAVEARITAEAASKEQLRWQLQAHEALGKLLEDAFAGALPPVRWEILSSGCGLSAWCDGHQVSSREATWQAWARHLGPPLRVSDHTSSHTGLRRLMAYWDSYRPAGSRRSVTVALVADIPADVDAGGEGE